MDDDSVTLRNDSSHTLVVTIRNNDPSAGTGMGTVIVPPNEEFRFDTGETLKGVIVAVSDAT